MPPALDPRRPAPATHIGRLVHTWQAQGHLVARSSHRTALTRDRRPATGTVVRGRPTRSTPA